VTIEIKKPELEQLIEKRLRTGQFRDVEELLTTALTKLSDDCRFDRDVRREAVQRMKDFSKQGKLRLGEPVTRELLHEGHRY
jgi:hypothetical protein